MSSIVQRSCLRIAIFIVVCSVVGCLWQYEVSLKDAGGPVAAMAFLVLAPAFLCWFFAGEIWQQKLSRTTFVAPLFGLGILTGAAFFDGVVFRIRTTSTRMQISNNLKQLCLAMHDYQEKFGSLPSAALQSPEGKPLLSWRVLLLPFLEQKPLFDQFHLNEPWDSPHNIQLLERIPPSFQSPNEGLVMVPLQTYYQVFVGPSAAFEDNKKLKVPEDFPDGASNTILIVEARHPVPWTQPVDIPFGPNLPLPELGAPRSNGLPLVFTVGLVDGSVRSAGIGISAEVLRSWVTRNGGEKRLDFD